MPSVSSVGYEGQTVDGLLSRLRLRGVDLVVDVRLNAISRKRGFSKTALATALAGEGIEYLHLPALGNHRDNRDGYASVGNEDAKVARERFRDGLATDDAISALRQVAKLAETKHVALFCFEADEEHCHRQQVREAIDQILTANVAPAA